jgi:hypothetical protein
LTKNNVEASYPPVSSVTHTEQIAKTIGCHQKTVGRVLALESTPEKIPSKKNIGRPPLIDSEGRERLKALVTDGKRQFTAKALCTAFEDKKESQCASKPSDAPFTKPASTPGSLFASHSSRKPTGSSGLRGAGTTGLEAEGLEEGFFHR